MVQLHDGQTVTRPDLLRFSRQHLAGYKQPRRIRFVQQLPQTASGKIARQAVQALMIKESY
jgi:acyl-coenzyme A synthetase/AMP-(fatty) acid ligase